MNHLIDYFSLSLSLRRVVMAVGLLVFPLQCMAQFALSVLPWADVPLPATVPTQPASEPDARIVDKWDYTVFNPTPRDRLREMNTDRPDTTESPFTIDAGHYQIEFSLADYTFDRWNNDSQEIHSWDFMPMLFKVGLLNNLDLQVGLNPYNWQRTTNLTTNARDIAEGFGDTVLRLKTNLWGNDGGSWAFGIMPYAKFPSADKDLGNGKVESGLILPVSFSLPADFEMGMMVQFDFKRSQANDRYVTDLVHTITFSHSIFGNLSGYIEYAGFTNLNHDEKYRAYADTGLTYGLTPDIQLDGGVRIGLTKASDDMGLFTGISFRF